MIPQNHFLEAGIVLCFAISYTEKQPLKVRFLEFRFLFAAAFASP